MKPAEIREKTTNELNKLSQELSKEVFQLKFKMGSGQLKQTTDIRKKRKDLARVKTILREKTKQEAGNERK